MKDTTRDVTPESLRSLGTFIFLVKKAGKSAHVLEARKPN